VDTDRPPNDLKGARVLVGVTYHRNDGRADHVQVHGTVQRVDATVIEIVRPDGTVFALPPAPEAFARAERGVYSLRSTGEEIRDPDYLAQFEVYPPNDSMQPTPPITPIREDPRRQE
jgi:hypothetical protein